MKTICVFCGSGFGGNEAYSRAAAEFGGLIANKGLELIYGGSNLGLMGLVSSAVRDAGGSVTGIIPKRIADNVEGQIGIKVEVVDDMHQRKARMYELSDAVVGLPGGIGTMDEFFETWVWNQLGYHNMPLALLNVDGYYDKLMEFIDHMNGQGFLRDSQRQSLIVESDPERLLKELIGWSPAEGVKWETVG